MKKEVRYRSHVKIRVSPEFKELMRIAASKHGITYSEYIRKLVLAEVKSMGLLGDDEDVE